MFTVRLSGNATYSDEINMAASGRESMRIYSESLQHFNVIVTLSVLRSLCVMTLLFLQLSGHSLIDNCSMIRRTAFNFYSAGWFDWQFDG
jgi:hypothetical protein